MVFGMGGNSIEIDVESNGVEKVNAKLATTESRLGAMGSRAKKAGMALGAIGVGGIAAVGAAMGKSVQTASKFQDAMVEIQKVTDPETMRKMSGSIREMAETIPLAQTELAAITEDAARFGIRGQKNLEDFTKATAKMATATDLNANTAGEAFAKLSKLTKTPISKVENLGSSINSLSNTAATSSQEIVDAMMRSAGVLSSSGLGQTQIAALSASLNEVSESSERAGTRLRRLGQEVLQPTGKSFTALAQTLFGHNRSVEEAQKKYRQMAKAAPLKIIRMLTQRMKSGGKSAQQLNKALSTTSRQALSGLGQNLKGLDKNLQTANQSFKEGTSLQREFDAQSKTFSNQLQLLKNRLGNVGITIGNMLLPVLTRLTKRVSAAISDFMKWNKSMNGMPVKVGLVATAVGSLTAAISGLYLYLGSIMGPLLGLPGALASVKVAALTTGGAITGFAQSVFLLSRRLVTLPARLAASTGAMITNRFTAANLGRTYGLLVARTKALALSLLTLPKRYALATAAAARTAVTNFTLSGAFSTLTASVWASVTALGSVTATLAALALPITALVATVAALYLAWKKNFLGIRNLTKGVTKAIKALIRGDIGAAKTALMTGSRQMRRAFSKHMGGILRTGRKVWNQVRKVFNTALTFIDKNLFQPTVNRIRRVWNTFGDDLLREMRKTWNSINNTIVAPAVTKTTKLFRTVKRVGTMLWNTFGNEIVTTARITFDAISRIVTIAVDGIITLLRSLLAFFRGDWKAGIRIMANFWRRTFNRVKKFINRWKDEIIGVFQGTINGIIKIFRGLYNTLIGNSIVPEMLSAITSRVTSFKRTVTGRFRTFVNDVERFFRNLGNNARRIVSNSMKAVHDRFAQTFVNVRNRASAWGRTVVNTVQGALNDMKNAAQGWVSDFVAPFRKAKNRVIGKFNELKNTVVGNSIVPDMLAMTISESDAWVDGFVSPFQKAKKRVINELKELKNKATGQASGVSDGLRKAFNNRVWNQMFAFDEANAKIREMIRQGGKGVSGSVQSDGTLMNAGATMAAASRHGLVGSKGDLLRKFANRVKNMSKSDLHRDPGGPNDVFSAYTFDSKEEAATSDLINKSGWSPFEMATGGLVTGPTNALVGEGRHDEFVTPRPLMEKILGDMASKSIASVLPSSPMGANVGAYIEKVVVNANSHEEGRQAAKGFAEELRSQNISGPGSR